MVDPPQTSSLIVFNFGPIFFFYVLKIYPRSFGFIHVNNYSCLVYFRPSLLSNFQKNNSSFIKQNFQNMHSTVFLSLLIEMGQSYYSETILFIHVLLQNRGLQTKKNQLRTLAPKYIFYQAGVYFLPRSWKIPPPLLTPPYCQEEKKLGEGNYQTSWKYPLPCFAILFSIISPNISLL